MAESVKTETPSWLAGLAPVSQKKHRCPTCEDTFSEIKALKAHCIMVHGIRAPMMPLGSPPPLWKAEVSMKSPVDTNGDGNGSEDSRTRSGAANKRTSLAPMSAPSRATRRRRSDVVSSIAVNGLDTTSTPSANGLLEPVSENREMALSAFKANGHEGHQTPLAPSSSERRRIQCSKCQKSVRGCDLKNHRCFSEVEEKRARYTCAKPDCGMTFSGITQLVKHRREAHSKIKTNESNGTSETASLASKFACEVCGKVFANMPCVRTHRIREHGLLCKICQKRYHRDEMDCHPCRNPTQPITNVANEVDDEAYLTPCEYDFEPSDDEGESEEEKAEDVSQIIAIALNNWPAWHSRPMSCDLCGLLVAYIHSHLLQAHPNHMFCGLCSKLQPANKFRSHFCSGLRR